MDANIQPLLDQIQRDGFERAEAEAKRVVTQAKGEAEKILRDAEKEAGKRASKASDEAKLVLENGRRALEQAARDIIIDIGRSLELFVSSLISEKTAEALTPAVVADLVKEVVTSFCEGGMKEERVEVLLGPEHKERVIGQFLTEFKERLQKTGIKIVADGCIERGFKLSVENGRIYFDFTPAAIADSLCTLVAPCFEEAVRKAVKPFQDQE